MKKKLFIINFVLGAILSSCNLDKAPLDEVQPETFFTTEVELKLYTNSFYKSLPSGTVLIFNETVDNVVATGIRSEINGSRIVPNVGGEWDREKWGQLRNINFFLENSPKCKDEAARKRYDAVAKYFRANFYFDMVKRFGDVPWYSKSISEEDRIALQKARDPRALVMDSVLADIDYAIANLPSIKTVNEVNKSTALALKSRICLYEGTFRKYHSEFKLPDADKFLDLSIEASSNLMGSNQYSLYSTDTPESDYLNLFNSLTPKTSEMILVRGFSDGAQVFHSANYFTIAVSYGRPGLEKRFINSYLMRDGKRFTDIDSYDKMDFTAETKNRDPRLSQTVRTPGYTRVGENQKLVTEFGSTVSGYQLIKYVTARSQDTHRNTNALPLLRYAEVLLNYAEAKAERGLLAQSDLDKSINFIRKRVGMPNLIMTEANNNPDNYLMQQYTHVEGSSKGVILEIRRERTIELVMENLRWDDIMRWKEGASLTLPSKGVYFPKLGEYDLDEDGIIDMVLYKDKKPENTAKGVQFLRAGEDFVLEDGDHGNVMVNSQFTKKWDENKDYLYPIPIQERLLNPNLTQNLGWDDGIN